MKTRRGHRVGIFLLLGLLGAALSTSASAGASTSAGASADTSTREAPPRGGSLVIDHERLVAYAADADNNALHRVDLLSGVASTTPLGCAPEQIVLLGGGRLAIALRGCSKVALFDVNVAGDASLIASADVPADPFGLAATPRGELLVTSAWGRAVTALDASTLQVLWSVPVRREPRSVSVTPDGSRAFITHLVGGAISVLDLDPAAGPSSPPAARPLLAPSGAYQNRVDRALGAAPLRPTAALAYASALSESGSRLFVPHVIEQSGALTARSVSSGSYGGVSVEQETSAASVAVIATLGPPGLPGAEPSGPPSRYGERVLGVATPPPPPNKPPPLGIPSGGPFGDSDPIDRMALISADTFRQLAVAPNNAPTRQARAAAVLGSSLFVASLGTNELCELDARALDPAMSALRCVTVGEGPTGVDVDRRIGVAVTWNQFSHDLSIVHLASGLVETIPVASDPLDHLASAGRRLFYTERDRRVARDGRSCAGCHPDGRDDGVVWSLGEGPRQTPTLVGRLDSGPFGWRAKHLRLEDNMSETMSRLGGAGLPPARLAELAAFMRSMPAPHRGTPAPLSSDASRGRDLFVSADVGCAACHSLERDASDRRLHDVASAAMLDQAKSFRTPPLLFVADTAPYFHDGRYDTLEQLLADNYDRMGSTTHLSPADIQALAAFLRTL